MERLNRDDAAILGLENAAILGHTLKLIVVGPDAAGRPPDLAEVRARVTERIDRVTRLHQRVVFDDDGEACWEADPNFDLDRHILAVDAPTPVDHGGFERIVGDLMAQRLDHERPLWRMDVIEGLEDGCTAIAWRFHHCMADGMTGIRWLGELFWDESKASTSAAPTPTPGKEPGVAAEGERLDLRDRAARAGAAPAALARELAGEARARRRSPLDHHISRHRAVAFTTRSLTDLKRIGKAFEHHATVNDVVLAAVGGGLARWRASISEPLADIRVQVPVSLHRRDEDPDQAGNRDSFLFVDLPLAEPDPARRLEAISAETRERKSHHDAEVLYSFFHGISHGRPLTAVAERLAAGARAFNLAISNVPGPREQKDSMGRRVVALYSMAEPADRHALRVSTVSLAGEIAFSLCADPTVVPKLDTIARGIDAEIDALLDRAA